MGRFWLRQRKFRKEKPIRDILEKFFRSLGVEERLEENLAFAYWDSVVGKEIANHTEPEKIVKGTVMVKVDNDVWRNELSFFKHEIIQKLNQKIGKKIIQEIKFY
jgi:predicted nucleic acid-binding Zn ribbon protein